MLKKNFISDFIKGSKMIKIKIDLENATNMQSQPLSAIFSAMSYLPDLRREENIDIYK
jgi:hypothetical protein